MKNKKSQGMPINVIIIAAIALIALIVIIAIFTGIIGSTTKNIQSCAAKDGTCADELDGKKCGGDYPIPLIVSGDCEKTTPKNLCCLKKPDLKEE